MCDCGCSKEKTRDNKQVVTKKGDRLECKECGLTVLIEKPCCCKACDITCCGKTMQIV
jgi:hypothetical protein